MAKEFKIKSSDGVTTYNVSFELMNDKLRVKCGCTAGVMGKLCRHKSQLLLGDHTGLVELSQLSDFHEAMNWVKQSQIPSLLGQVSVAEKELERAKMDLDKLKKSLEKALRDGA